MTIKTLSAKKCQPRNSEKY